MKSQTDLDTLLLALRGAESFVITSHAQPDGDSVGSMLALRHLLRALGKEHITCVIDGPVPKVFQWLDGAGTIHENGYPAVQADLGIVVDVAQRERLGRTADVVYAARRVAVLDHHLEHDADGDLAIVDPAYGAVGEIIVELFLRAGVPISRAAAECAYVSIVTDTGGFRYANTTPRTHRLTAHLVETGIDVFAVSCRVFDVISSAKFELLRRALQRMQCDAGGRLAYTVLRLDDMREAAADHEDVNGLVEFARNIEGVDVGILFREIDSGTTKVSIRSRVLNSARFLSEFGGGGHAGAAGATLQLPLDTACSKVLERARQLLGEAA